MVEDAVTNPGSAHETANARQPFCHLQFEACGEVCYIVATQWEEAGSGGCVRSGHLTCVTNLCTLNKPEPHPACGPGVILG